MLFLLSLNLLFVLAALHVHFILEDLAALVFTCLKLLEQRCVFKHLGTVFVTLLLHFYLLSVK
jgi:hypothetical protein